MFDGRARLWCESPDGLAILELIGPPQDISQASITVAVPSDSPGLLALNSVYMLGLMKQAAPRWPQGIDWLTANVSDVVDKGEIITRQQGLEVSLTSIVELGMLSLRINGIEGGATLAGKVLPTAVPTPFPTIGQPPDVEATKTALDAIDAHRRQVAEATQIAVAAQQEAERHAASLEATRVAELPTPEPTPTPLPTSTPHPATFCTEWEALVLGWIKQGHNYRHGSVNQPADGVPDHPQLPAGRAHRVCLTAFPLGFLPENDTMVRRWPNNKAKVGDGPGQLLPGLYEYRRPGDKRVEAKRCELILGYDDSGYNKHGEIVELSYGEPFTIRLFTYHEKVVASGFFADTEGTGDCSGRLYRIGD